MANDPGSVSLGLAFGQMIAQQSKNVVDLVSELNLPEPPPADLTTKLMTIEEAKKLYYPGYTPVPEGTENKILDALKIEAAAKKEQILIPYKQEIADKAIALAKEAEARGVVNVIQGVGMFTETGESETLYEYPVTSTPILKKILSNSTTVPPEMLPLTIAPLSNSNLKLNDPSATTSVPSITNVVNTGSSGEVTNPAGGTLDNTGTVVPASPASNENQVLDALGVDTSQAGAAITDQAGIVSGLTSPIEQMIQDVQGFLTDKSNTQLIMVVAALVAVIIIVSVIK